jgi:hypothetical protein
MINFIGIGAQKSGTSWVYTCLYEHPQVCAPIKEIHFFSRPRFSEGKEWYEAHFKKCAEGKLRGEFSTSYLYPHAKLIAILRNPIDRAFSQYRNAIKAGEIAESVSFDTYTKGEMSALEQGRYAEQLTRYFARFKKEQVLVLIYEDIKKDPIAFMRRIYEFLEIDPTFVSSMVHDEINIARTPKHVFIDRTMHHVSETLRRIGFDRFVHLVRRSGLPDIVRSLNTKKSKETRHTTTFDRDEFRAHFTHDVSTLSQIIGRDMNQEWNI